jgi:hypothetical protein
LVLPAVLKGVCKQVKQINTPHTPTKLTCDMSLSTPNTHVNSSSTAALTPVATLHPFCIPDARLAAPCAVCSICSTAAASAPSRQHTAVSAAHHLPYTPCRWRPAVLLMRHRQQQQQASSLASSHLTHQTQRRMIINSGSQPHACSLPFLPPPPAAFPASPGTS